MNLWGTRVKPSLFNPSYIHLRGISKYLRDFMAVHSPKNVLDVGCGDLPYKEYFKFCDYVPCDLPYNKLARLHCTAENLKVDSNSMYCVISTQMLEHAKDPSVCMAEFYRVLKPGGTLLLSTHGIWPHHPNPIDNWRWTGEGLAQLAKNAGFKIVKITGIGGGPSVPLQIIQAELIMIFKESKRSSVFIVGSLSLIINPISILLDKTFEIFYGAKTFMPISTVYMIEATK